MDVRSTFIVVMNELKISNTDLARASGVCVSVVSRFIKCGASIHITTFERLFRSLPVEGKTLFVRMFVWECDTTSELSIIEEEPLTSKIT